MKPMQQHQKWNQNTEIRVPELLSPAGDYESFLAAMRAGADAVYFAGGRFGARAYAHNFSEEEVVRAIRYAHLHGKKTYLTVNTLVKESELEDLVPFMKPFAEEGLDGVIIQDLGAIRTLREQFPWVELHASTQMAVTGVYGAKWLKTLGMTRVVPARELSLEELKAIRDKAGVEVEVFVHGAMCYSYSGMCLFSSMIGGRSGNRGRCAQPCRLPYPQDYLLSLKDQCAIERIPELIRAGMDSFKIEGRMKKPEYTAGVTDCYRRTIDRCLEAFAGGGEPSQPLLSKRDNRLLHALYMRSEVGEGYLHQHNGRSMVTLGQPGYTGTSEEVLSAIRSSFPPVEEKVPVSVFLRVVAGEPAQLTLLDEAGHCVSVEGDVVQKADKKPMDEAQLRKQMNRFGDSLLTPSSIEIDFGQDAGTAGVFLPVSALNALRRGAAEEMIRSMTGREAAATKATEEDERKMPVAEGSGNTEDHKVSHRQGLDILTTTAQQTGALLRTLEQADALPVRRLYLPLSLLVHEQAEAWAQICRNRELEVYALLPYILREEDRNPAEADIRNLVLEGGSRLPVSGVLIRNVEELGLLRDARYAGGMVADAGLYEWNHAAMAELASHLTEITAPLELNGHELRDLFGEGHQQLPAQLIVYGRAPMMISAGCVHQTREGCTGERYRGEAFFDSLTDRKHHTMPVSIDCRYCYNVIWNEVPTSLHKHLPQILREDPGIDTFRLEFSSEKPEECVSILQYYAQYLERLWENRSGKDAGTVMEPPYESFTAGHYHRGVE